MPNCYIDYCGPKRKLKVWRYPGVPIPYKCSFKYYDPTVTKKK